MVIHNLTILAVYASSAVTTALNIGLIVYQRRRMRRISFSVDAAQGEMQEIEQRLTVLEENRWLNVAA